MRFVNSFKVRLLVGMCVVVLLLGGASAFGGTIYVAEGASGAGSSWGDAYGSLQDALDDAVSSDEIWVATGTYYPDPDRRNNPRRACFQMINGVAIYGGFDGTETALDQRDVQNNETILSGDIGVAGEISDNCFHIFYHPEGISLDATAILDGFTITAGNADGSGSHDSGGGMYNKESNPTVSNCTFAGNSAGYGGGMYNEASSPTVTNCTFSGNSAGDGSGMYNWDSSPTVADCTFIGNSAVHGGGGMCNEENSNPTVADCTFSGNSAVHGGGMCNRRGMFNNYGSSPTVTDCTFIGNSANGGTFSGGNGGGMYNEFSNPIVTDCTFSGNSANGGEWNLGDGGGMYNAVSNPTVTGCTFSSNSAEGGGGMCNYWESSPTVRNCTFTDNSAGIYGGGGMYNNWYCHPIVTNCILWGNTAASEGNDIYNNDTDSRPPVISYCDIAGCGGSGGAWDSSLGDDGGGNIDADPAFVDAAFGDCHLLLDSPCIDTGDSAAVTEATDLDGQPRIMDGDGNGTAVVDMGAYEYQLFVYGDIVYVDQDATSGANNGLSWDDAFNSLGDALAVATSGDAILVAEGVYLPSPDGLDDPREAAFTLKNGVTIKGGYAGYGAVDPNERNIQLYETILSGDIGVPGEISDNCYHVFYHPDGVSLNATAILDGFTITAGNANGSGVHLSGGGMYNYSSSPTVSNCTFSGNLTEGFGGGGMYNINCSPTVTNCTFSGNSALWAGGGIFNDNYSSPTVTGCTFSGNWAYDGGGMYNWSSSPTVSNCTFTSNSAVDNGGGMYNWSSSPTVSNCTFTDNSTTEEYGGGGGMCNDWNSSPTVTNCTFSGNSAHYYGGGMYNDYNSPTVRNCTFTSNSAGNGGGGMYNYATAVSVIGSVFMNNNARSGGGMCNRSGDMTVSNCSFVGNKAIGGDHGNTSPGWGGAIYNYDCTSTLSNCIIWGNIATDGGDQIAVIDSSLRNFRTFVTYCNVQDGIDGVFLNLTGDIPLYWYRNNIDLNPMFVDADGGDLRLLAGSNCIDGGHNYFVDPNSVDLVGNPRIMDGDGDGIGVVDMGAYEMANLVVLLDFLCQDIIDLELDPGTENSLLTKLDTAISKLEDDNEKNDAAAINSLEAFINAVEAQSGKKILEADAEALIAAAQQIIDLSGSE